MNKVQRSIDFEIRHRGGDFYNNEPIGNRDRETDFSEPTEASVWYEPISSSIPARGRSLGIEVTKFILCSLVIGLISWATFASQYGTPKTVQILKSIKRKAAAELGIAPSLSTTLASTPLQLPLQDQGKSVADRPSTAPAYLNPDCFQHQQDLIAGDVANVRAKLEQLVSSQSKMAAQLSAIKTAEDSLRDRDWWLTHSAPLEVPQSKIQHQIIQTKGDPAGSKPKAGRPIH
jgi:hypothetical protein